MVPFMRAVPERIPPRPLLCPPPSTLKVATLNDTRVGAAAVDCWGAASPLPGIGIETPAALAGARVTAAARAGAAARVANFFTGVSWCRGIQGRPTVRTGPAERSRP